jgi:outer membrane receptor for ferric coprogen and ferric-rhodotorulic acid
VAQAIYTVLGDATIDGLELDVKGSLGSGWRWSANYTFETISTTAPVFTRDYAHSAPRHKVNVQLGYTNGKWEADGYLGFVSQVLVPQQVAPDVFQSTPVSDFVRAQGRVAYHILPKLLVEAIVSSGFADNPIARQPAQGYVSLVANF